VKPHELRVARVIDETHDARSFVFEVPPELRERFAYRAGQHLTFEVPLASETILRCYSLASAPEHDEPHKVTVKRVEDGRGSNWFHDHVAAGSVLRVLPPLGRFVLHDETVPLLFFAGGSGITPVVSLIKSALATTQRRIRLLYANRDARSVIFRGELDALANEHAARLEVRHHLDDEAGFVTPDEVRAALAGFETAACYLCGPGPFMTGVEATLREAGVPESHVHIEHFEQPTEHAATGVTEAVPTEGADRGRPERDRRAPRRQEPPGSVHGRADAPGRGPGRGPRAAVRMRGGVLRIVCREAHPGRGRARSERRVQRRGARAGLDPHLPRPSGLAGVRDQLGQLAPPRSGMRSARTARRRACGARSRP
jgi:3-ketosteroid 9alpha-monooxygenase subunit B